MMLTLWTCQLSSLCERLLGRSIRTEVNETAPKGLFPGAAAGTCLFALTSQPLRRPGQPKAAVPDSCIRAASAPGERSCIHGKPMAETGQSHFPGHSALRCQGSRRRRPDTGGWVGGCGFSVRCEYRGPLPDVLKPDIQRVGTHWNQGFMAFQLTRRIRIVVLVVPTWHESGFREGVAQLRGRGYRDGRGRNL